MKTSHDYLFCYTITEYNKLDAKLLFVYLEALLFAELAVVVVVVVLLLELADAVFMDAAVASAVLAEEVLLSVAVDELIVDDPSAAAAAASAFGLSKRSMTALALDNIDLAKLSLTNIPNKKKLMHKI